MSASRAEEIERRTMAKVSARLVPFLILCYFVSYLDRVNVGFAALTMNKALGLSATAFGFGAGIFFLTYFLLEVPSNLILARVGARRWIARIMLTWGIISGLMAAIPQIATATGGSGETVFYVIRALLGAAEAGFFPGIIFYLTLWYPATYRARIVSGFMVAVPLSSAIGAPVSTAILYMDGALGLAGWQWLFVIEAIPALILGFAVLAFLDDRPAGARWLTADERTWLVERLEAERRVRESARRFSIVEALGDTKVLLLSFVYFGGVACLYGIGFWLPQIVNGFGLPIMGTGVLAAVPYVVGALAMIYWGRRSDRTGERREHVAVAMLITGLGICASVMFDGPTGKMIALTCAVCGICGFLPVFWTLPTAFLSGTAAAAGIAVINSLGNLSGYVGPFVIGKVKDATGSFTVGLIIIAGLAFLSMLVALAIEHDSKLEKLPDAAAGE
jgi:ACS family tartrate transporter-like MFS transporter